MSATPPGDLRPLEGLLVVDLCSDLPGQVCTKILADAGATVVRDPAVSSTVDAAWSNFLGLGKFAMRPATSEVSVIGGADMQPSLVADVVVTDGEAPTEVVVLAHLLREPLLVALPPFGEGPYESLLADDLVLAALSGLADCTPGFPDRQDAVEPPVQSRAPLAAFAAGVISGIAVLGALSQRASGATDPKTVEVASLEAVIWMLVSEWSLCAYGGEAPGRRRKARTLEPNCYLRTRDGYIVVVATSDRHWTDVVEIMAWPKWADARFETVEMRAANVVQLHRHLQEWMADASAQEFMEAAQARGVPCAMYKELASVLETEQLAATEALEQIDGSATPADPIVVNGVRRRRGADRSYAEPTEGDWGGSEVLPAPLAGVRVVDLTQMVAGPFAGQLLAALGAEVSIVESESHLVSRAFGPFAGTPEHDASANFNYCNRGKTSVQIDLKHPEGRTVLARLIANADVVLENFSLRAARNLHLSYDEIRADRPDVILASISAFGRIGPWGPYVSHHGGVTALTGLASALKDPRGMPRLVGAILPDVLTGSYTALAVVQAVMARRRTGRGCHIEVSMLDVILNAMAGLVREAEVDHKLLPHEPCFFPSMEADRYLAVSTRSGPLSDEQIGSIARKHTRWEATEILQESGHRAAPVLDLSEVISSPHLLARGFVLTESHPVAGRRPVPGVPWKFDGVRPTLRPAPLLGDGTRRVLGGVAQIEIAELDRLTHSGVLR